jgi:MFS family permease
MPGDDGVHATGPVPAARRSLTLACAAVLLTAADTYVVVLALPDMMASVGLATIDLPRAAPIVSLFLLGYIAVLPLLGRLSDLYGRLPVLLGCLLLFTAGSAVTAGGGTLNLVVLGRFLQGLGGGGLVPVTLALVADVWPADRRGVPLGAVGAVQELGSVVGPLYGAVLIAASGWRLIFWTNLVLGLLLAVGLATFGRPHPAPSRAPAAPPPATHRPWWRRDAVGALLLVLALAAGALAAQPPHGLTTDLTFGALTDPVLAGQGWSTPLWLIALGALLAALLRELTASRPLLPLRSAPRVARQIDGLGALLLAAALGCVVFAFASPDPEHQTLNAGGVPLLVAAVLLLGLFVLRERFAAPPLLPLRAFRPRSAWGALLVSFLAGSALIAALVDVPLFARSTVYPDSQFGASLVLLRFLAGVPIGALAGGLALRRLPPRLVASVGLLLAAAGLARMAGWQPDALAGFGEADLDLFVAGLGVGLAVAPVNDAALRAVGDELHGLVSALVVVLRSTGMLIGLSALTAFGLSRFRAETARLPAPGVICPADPLNCPQYSDGLRTALLHQLSAVFAGAAVCALLGAVAAALLLGARRRAADPAPGLGSVIAG